jgi:hypothetical protein
LSAVTALIAFEMASSSASHVRAAVARSAVLILDQHFYSGGGLPPIVGDWNGALRSNAFGVVIIGRLAAQRRDDTGWSRATST